MEYFFTREQLDEIKNQLTINQIYNLLEELGGEPREYNNYIISRTICHHSSGEGSHKLYYYDNNKLFHCYTDGCSKSSFDIYELVKKVKNNNNIYQYYYSHSGKLLTRQWQLYDAVNYIIAYFNIHNIINFNVFNITTTKLEDWVILNKYQKKQSEYINKKPKVEFKYYNEEILTYLPRPRIVPWEQEGISNDIIQQRKIAYDPINQGIVIPHYNENNKLIGIRERTLIKEEEEYGKYKPAIINGIMYNHPLGFANYNLNNSKEKIQQLKKVIVFESEKSCLKYASIFGIENDISVAVCGSSISSYQMQLLLSLKPNEIIIGFDKQFQQIGDDEWKKWTKKLKDIHKRYGKYVQISYLFDKKDLLDYKDSPIDKGEEIFLNLYRNRVII